ncbi:Ig-like domain-containing protein [Roseateles cellulosilyticus]|uniref:Ig-like domain-containing protein n=1 Tax=Pelomonas cellulosilytica TaxID=2906762 RepID=A0ABS8Y1B9_9BURK|nr:Ig-like domain-containing protein [Pelomonas sp. P8]MCE4558098.1 Ig-like domain-containing protein [Pelomonas sp. P8]
MPDAPAPLAQAAADSYTLVWNAPATLGVTDNDTTAGGTPNLAIDGAPKNGTATVSGTKVTYTPNPGFFGADSFSYKLSVGGASQSATVNLAVEAALTLNGRVTDGPIANAAVKVSVGSQSFSATADASGKYSVAIKTSQPGDFVTLTAAGAGAQAQLVLTSLVGEARSLAAAARDGKLAAEQKAGLDVTHVTAAQAGLISQAGTVPKTDAELATALQGLSPQTVLDTAAAVKLVVDGGTALPTGVADTRELLNSSSALGEFRTTLLRDKPLALEAARESTRDDPLLSKAPPTPAANGDPVTLIYAYGEEAGTAQVRVLTLRADGTGTEVSDAPRSITWKLDGGALAVTYDRFIEQTFEAFSTAYIGDKPIDSEPAFKLVVRGLRLSDLGSDGGRGALASVTTVGSTVDLEGPQMGVFKDVSGGSLMRRHANGALLFKAEDFQVGTKLAGLSAGMGVDAGGLLLSNQDVATFTSPTELSLARTGLAGKWKIVDGKLRVDLPDGSYLYTSLGKGPLGDSRWLLQRLDANGAPVSAHELGVVPAAPPTLDRAAWTAKTWKSNIGASTGEPVIFRLLDDARSSVSSAARGQGPVVADFTRYWRLLEDGGVDIARAESSSCVVYLPSGAAGPTACRLSQRRLWQPVAQTGSIVWVMQQGPILFNGFNEANATRWSLVALTGY